MFPLYIRAAVFIAAIILIFLLPAFLMYFLGFKPRENNIDRYIETRCYIAQHDIRKVSCPYECNCNYNINNKYVCDTCYTDCYNGYVHIEYMIGDKKHDIIKPTINRTTEEEIIKVLDHDAPINSYIACSYRKNNHSDITFDLDAEIDNYKSKESAHSYYLGFIFFCMTGGMIFMTWVLGEIIYCVKRYIQW